MLTADRDSKGLITGKRKENESGMVATHLNKTVPFSHSRFFFFILWIFIYFFPSQANADNKLIVPYFSQLDSRWSTDPMSSSSYLVKSWGCTMTCVAMAFNYYGINAVNYTYNDYFTNDVNPRDLNLYLSQNGGYNAGNYLVWSVATNYSNASSKGIQYMSGSSQDWQNGINARDSTTLVNEINSGYPGLVQVYTGYATYPWHWVLATGIEGSIIYINDPYWQDKTTLDSYNNTIYAVRVYHGPVLPIIPPTNFSPT